WRASTFLQSIDSVGGHALRHPRRPRRFPMSLQELMRQRREKLARWRAAGVEPYAYRYDVTHHAGELLARGEAVTADPGERVRVAGRIMSLRGHGKAGFGHLLDRSGSIQLYFRADHLGPQFARYELLDV